MALCAEMLLLGGLARTADSARTKLQQALDSGAAAEHFQRMVAALGGPKRFVDDPWRHMERASVVVPVLPARSGRVSRIDTRAVGMAVVGLGGGRTRPQDPVDHAVGLTRLAGVGDRVGADEPLAIVHARTAAAGHVAADAVRAAYRIGGRSSPPSAPVIDRITA
jgi:thymidine phosphorylase